jgi:hypothetical protein
VDGIAHGHFIARAFGWPRPSSPPSFWKDNGVPGCRESLIRCGHGEQQNTPPQKSVALLHALAKGAEASPTYNFPFPTEPNARWSEIAKTLSGSEYQPPLG